MVKVAFFSPFQPQKSGISDFCEELLMYLDKYVDVELFTNTDMTNEYLKQHYKVHRMESFKDEAVRSQFDLYVYHIGNNYKYHEDIYQMCLAYPGIVELHDLSIHSFMAEITIARNDAKAYRDLVAYSHGEYGANIVDRYLQGKEESPWSKYPMELPVNRHLIDHALAVIVHSDYAKQYIKAIAPLKVVVNIPLHAAQLLPREEKPSSQLVLATFGSVTITRRIEAILKVLGKINRERKLDFMYYIVGPLADERVKLHQLIAENGLQGRVVSTGYVSTEEYENYLSMCDVAINLRYPFYGESSAALHRLLGAGKATIVTNIGSFKEYPNDVVYKVDYASNEMVELEQAILQLATNGSLRRSYGEQALLYAKTYCDIEKNAIHYAAFFEDVMQNTFRESDCYEHLVDEMFALTLTDEAYVTHISEKCLLFD